ncbi:MAG TPA: Gfo/Idh/MocA family oxidoreductase, partial [Brachybacterium sp.]|nr:Gfo/Idh/MocA family oxidoreductase [Brachybacterium sp.]
MSDLRIGVVGFGARASLARHAHRPGEGSRITVVADPAKQGRDLARERLGEEVATVESVEELLAGHEVDAVMILAPDFAHASVALQTLEAGIPTFCEKPMAISVEDTDAMLALAKEKRARLYIGHNMRHMPVVRQMKE